MSTPKAQLVDIEFTRGIRQDLEENLLPNGALVTATDVEFDKAGRLQKRDGFTAVGTSTLGKVSTFSGIARGLKQGAMGERLVFTDENTHVSFATPNKMCAAGEYDQTSVLRASITSKMQLGADQAGLIGRSDSTFVSGALGSWFVVVYSQKNQFSTNYDLLIDVVDSVTKAKILSGWRLATAASADLQHRVLAVGSKVFIFQSFTGNANIIYYTLDLSGGTIPILPTTSLNLVTDADTTLPIFDVDVTAGGFAIAYRFRSGGAGTERIKVVRYDSTPSVLGFAYDWKFGGATAWTSTAIAVLGARTTSDKVFVAAGDSTNTTIDFLSAAYDLSSQAISSQVSTPGVLDGWAPTDAPRQMTLGRISTTKAALLWSACQVSLAAATKGPSGPIFMATITDSGGGIVGYTQIAPAFSGYCLGSKLFSDANGNLYAFARFNNPGSAAQNHFLLLDFFSNANQTFRRPTPIAHVANGLVPVAVQLLDPGLPGVANLGNGKFLFAAQTNIGASILSGQSISCWTIETLNSKRYISTPANGALIVAGGTPLAYDGQRLVESSFYSYPEVGTPTGSGVTTIPAGTYQYRFVYEWTDGVGNRHQSAASPAVSITVPVGGYANIATQVSTLHATRKQVVPNNSLGSYRDERAPVRIVPYRTTVGGTVFYRSSSSLVNIMSTTEGGLIVANLVTFTDTELDFTLSTNEQLYTTGGGTGVLPSAAPPPCLLTEVHNGRVWGIDAEQPERLWCTKTFQPGEASGYSPGLQVFIPGAVQVNGVGGQDDKLYAMTMGGTYVGTYGPGVTNIGQGGFPDPILISADATCDDPRGVIVSTSGIYFTGPGQWGTTVNVIRRGNGTPIDIGKRIRDELNGTGGTPIIRGVTENIAKARIEFLFVDSETAPTKANVMLYHYDLLDEEQIGQWTKELPLAGVALESIGTWGGVTVVGTASGTNPVSIQSGTTGATTGTDIAVPYAFSVVTGDVRPFGLLGYGDIHSVSLLGSGRTRAGYLTLAASYDSRATFADTFRTVTSELSGAPIVRRWEPTTKKPVNGCVSYRIQEQVTGGSIGAGTLFTDGAILRGISIEATPLGGNARPTDTQFADTPPNF